MIGTGALSSQAFTDQQLIVNKLLKADVCWNWRVPPFAEEERKRNLSREFRLTSWAAWLNFDSLGTYGPIPAIKSFS
jgi:hypothetical protein